MYKQILPLLLAASMTYKDLDIKYTGPDIDGRSSLQGDQQVGGLVLEYGKGFPKGLYHLLLF